MSYDISAGTSTEVRRYRPVFSSGFLASCCQPVEGSSKVRSTSRVEPRAFRRCPGTRSHTRDRAGRSTLGHHRRVHKLAQSGQWSPVSAQSGIAPKSARTSCGPFLAITSELPRRAVFTGPVKTEGRPRQPQPRSPNAWCSCWGDPPRTTSEEVAHVRRTDSAGKRGCRATPLWPLLCAGPSSDVFAG